METYHLRHDLWDGGITPLLWFTPNLCRPHWGYLLYYPHRGIPLSGLALPRITYVIKFPCKPGSVFRNQSSSVFLTPAIPFISLISTWKATFFPPLDTHLHWKNFSQSPAQLPTGFCFSPYVCNVIRDTSLFIFSTFSLLYKNQGLLAFTNFAEIQQGCRRSCNLKLSSRKYSTAPYVHRMVISWPWWNISIRSFSLKGNPAAVSSVPNP